MSISKKINAGQIATFVAPNTANINNMGVTITLVFACEVHREAWLKRMRVIDNKATKAKTQDYKIRRKSSNLTYLVGPERIT